MNDPTAADSPPESATPSLPATLRRLRSIGILEGISTLTLFGIAMPLKYAAGMPQAVSIVGSVHGALFLIYLAAIVHVMHRHRWPARRGLALAVGAVIPFGPFVIDRRILTWHAADTGTQRTPAAASDQR